MLHLRKSFPMLLAITLLAGCRQDMHDQPRFKPLAKSDFYADLGSAREPVEGTVARGQLHEDTYFYTGKIGNNPGDYMPFPVTTEVLARGQERYNIYCAPCHSRTGRWQRHDCPTRFPSAAFLPHRAFAQSAAGIFLRRDDQRLRRHARLRVPNSGARPLVHRGLYPRVAIEPGCNDGRCTRRAAGAIGTSELRGEPGFGAVPGYRAPEIAELKRAQNERGAPANSWT